MFKDLALVKPTAAITVDLDTLHHYRAIHGFGDTGADDLADPTYTIGVKRLLELFERFGIRATLFVIGRDTHVPAHQALLQQAHEQGHELGNHTYEHRYDLRRLPPHIQATDVERGELAIANITGIRPCGFRTPGYNIDQQLMELLAQRRYLYDSSIFACPPYYFAKGAIMGAMAIGGKPSNSAMTRPDTLLAPITPYYPHAEQFWRRGQKGHMPLEIPMCVMPMTRFPIIGTSVHLLGRRGFDAIYPLLKRTYTSCFQLEFHAIDFMDRADVMDTRLHKAQPDLNTPWEKKLALYEHIFQRLSEDYTFNTLEHVAQTIEL